MGCVTATAKRRRKQARNGWRGTMNPMLLPHYPIPNPTADVRRDIVKAKARAVRQSKRA